MLFRLKLFGGASIEGPAGPLTGRGVQRRRLALLSLLAAAPGRGLSRDKLVALLWPDSDTERARHLLSDSVYRINQAIGGEAVVAAGDELRLNPERLPSDAGEFAGAIERGDWQRAVELHSAPFLDGFFLPGCGEYERWADAERERHARERARALENLASDAEARGEDAEAVRWWRMLAAHDPYSSRIALRLMRALEAAGERAAAVQYARIHTLLVREELGVEPDPEVPAYAQRLSAGTARDEPDVARLPADAARPVAEAPSLPSAGSNDPVEWVPVPSAGGTGDQGLAARHPSPPGRPRPPRLARLAALTGTVAVIALVLVVAIRELRPGGTAGPVGPTSIAVLPFEDLSEAGDQEYFADGITEELLVRLSRVDGLDVVGRTSAFAFKGKAVDVREIADRLGVTVVLGGSVKKSGERLRIFAQLVDATSGFELWSDTYEREQADVFAIQDDIARAIVTRLRGRLAGDDAMRGAPSPEDPLAYNLYLRGRFEWHKRTEQGLRNAADYFRQAVERAPDYARAHAGLGDAYAVLGFYDYLPPDDAFPSATLAAGHALEIDPTLAEPHATLGYSALYYDWDWQRAEAEFRRTVDLDPSYSTGHQWYANFLTAMGRFDEAVREMRTAQDLDPLSLIANAALGWVLYYAGEYERAIEQCTRTLELNPQFELAHLWRGLALEQLGRTEEELVELRRAVELSGGSAISRAALARAHAISGNADSARVLLRDLEQRGDGAYAPSFEIAKVHEALGDRTAALRWLERAHRQRSHSMAFLAVDPQLKRLRDDPAFVRLVQRVGLDRRPGVPPDGRLP